MKNFALFAGANYYPAGGMDDLVGRFDTLQEALAAAQDENPEDCTGGYDWFQIVDLTTFTVVAGG